MYEKTTRTVKKVVKQVRDLDEELDFSREEKTVVLDKALDVALRNDHEETQKEQTDVSSDDRDEEEQEFVDEENMHEGDKFNIRNADFKAESPSESDTEESNDSTYDSLDDLIQDKVGGE